jgi:putative PIN family toxin of toxin-antitoxin system
MKIVLDTNVLASGIFWGGMPQKIVEYWCQEELQVLASELILDEYLQTIQKLALKLKRPDLFSSWALILPTKITLVSVKKTFKLCRDPKDDMFIDCAVSGRAKYIVSGDQDLLVLEQAMGVEIVTPNHFLRTAFK